MSKFERKLERLINEYSIDTEPNTPDSFLQNILSCIEAFSVLMTKHKKLNGTEVREANNINTI